MANYKLDMSSFLKLSELDRLCLTEIYFKRCLSDKQINTHIYMRDDNKNKAISKLIDFGYIEIVLSRTGTNACFLTTLGVKAVKEILDMDDESPQSRSASDLKLHEQNINHQLALNDFVLLFGAIAKASNVEFSYFDQKYMPSCCSSMMPDGMIDTGDEILLLEMDMGSERSNSLAAKWNNYREFLSNRSQFYRGKRVTMYFILENVIRLRKRIDTVTATVSRFLLDSVGPDFEIMANSPKELLYSFYKSHTKDEDRLSIQRTLLKTHGFSFSSGSFPDVRVAFGSYVRCLSHSKQVLAKDGRPQEFLFDIWLDGRFSVLHKIVFFNKLQSALSHKYGRNIPYLVCVESEESIGRVLQKGNINPPRDLFFTTKERLESSVLYEALFQVGPDGEIYNFLNFSLSERNFERKLK